MQFVIAADHPSLPGHFPGRPVVPGVVVLEEVLARLAAQVGAPLARLTLVQVKFVQPLLPEQPAEIVLDVGADAAAWRFRVHCGERPIASGSVRLETA
jgi:3-hydroxyacyl-[acyl-carrier-protein] dehydratase